MSTLRTSRQTSGFLQGPSEPQGSGLKPQNPAPSQRKLWEPKRHSGSFWIVLDRPGASWSVLDVSGQLLTVVDDPAGGVDVQLQQVHDPLVLLGSFHEL